MLAGKGEQLESLRMETRGMELSRKGTSLWYLLALAAHKHKAQLWQYPKGELCMELASHALSAVKLTTADLHNSGVS